MSEPASKAKAAFASFNRGLAWFHRWTGVALCLLFVIWFASGAVLSFVPFPALGDHDRLAGSEPIAVASVIATPAAVLAAAGGGDRLSLIQAGGRPVYVVGRGKAGLTAVDAGDGVKRPLLNAAQVGAIAGAFSSAPVKAIHGPLMYDQWVVHQNFDPQRPFYRVALADAAGTDLYVSARTGEVVQRTRAGERAWNWAGAVTHWIYFTALRKSFAAWDQTVWWVSLVGVATALVGTWLGLYRTWKRMKGRRPDWSPFHGWLRWHHGVGLGVAAFVLTWIFSGWLSMDHGRLFSRGATGPTAQARFEGASLASALAKVPITALAPLAPARRITFSVVDGQAIAAGEGGPAGPQVLVLGGAEATPIPAVPRALLTAAAARGWTLASPTAHGPERRDALYRLAEGLPDRALRFDLVRPRGAGLYIDPVTGRTLALVDDSRKTYAWVYFALHTFNFPFLIDRPILRRVLELIPILFGFLFSLTGLVIAIKRLGITFAR
jgi:hypothetical protein